MSISGRYRDLAAEVAALQAPLAAATGGDDSRSARQVGKAIETLEEFRESVGEIPQMRLERELTPVLLKAHNYVDRGRVLLEDAEQAEWPPRLWEIQQKIYRLLNDL